MSAYKPAPGQVVSKCSEPIRPAAWVSMVPPTDTDHSFQLVQSGEAFCKECNLQLYFDYDFNGKDALDTGRWYASYNIPRVYTIPSCKDILMEKVLE